MLLNAFEGGTSVEFNRAAFAFFTKILSRWEGLARGNRLDGCPDIRVILVFSQVCFFSEGMELIHQFDFCHPYLIFS